MDRDEFEFALTQYLDGTLPEDQRVAIEEQLRTDQEAAAILDQYRRLDDVVRGVVRGAAPSMPLGDCNRLKWDRLAEAISQAIDDHTARPIFTIGWAQWAIAASILIAIGIYTLSYNRSANRSSPQLAQELTVQGPQAEVAAGPQMMDISVTPPAEANAAMSYTYDSLLTRRSVVALEGLPPAPTGQLR